MPQHEVEIILARQLASYLTMPIFIVDPAGTLIFYNEPAEAILGRRFDETGEMPLSEWTTIFEPSDASGAGVPAESLPLVAALRDRRPVHTAFSICGLDGHKRRLEVTALPLVGQAERILGALAIFWEAPGK